MSEAEKKRRLYYKENRKKWLKIGTIILASILLITAVCASVFFGMDRETYIRYKEEGDVKYSVTLKNNEIFKDPVLGEDNMYVAPLIDTVDMTFSYQLFMEQAAKYQYSYSADAHILIQDSATKMLIYKGRLGTETPELLPEETVSITEPQQSLFFKKKLSVDYGRYNDRATAIVDALALKGVICTLEVSMNIDVTGSVESAEQDKENTYTVSLQMPLNVDKVSFAETSSIPTGESKIIITNEGTARTVFLILTIVFLVLSVLFAIVFVAFIFLTRNTDINYNIKVNRIVSNYKSYIQKIVNPFDRTGYQLLVLDEFNALLEIRDTIQSPILMYENEDKTCATFMIPTNTSLLYVFEIKIADYDEIYKKVAEGEENADEVLVLLEDVDEDMLADALAMPTVPLSEIDYDEDFDAEADEGVEVIGVVSPVQKEHNKIHRYDPNGERVAKGDVVLVPSRDEESNNDTIRKATVAQGNHKVDPDNLVGPLQKIIGIFRSKAEELILPKDTHFGDESAEKSNQNQEAVAAETTDEADAEK